MIKHPNRILWTAILVAWTFDFLFWEKSPGISFAIFIGITLGAGIFLFKSENQSPSRRAWWLLLPIALFAIGTFIRREPFTTFINYLLTLVLMGILAHTLRGGRWLSYSLSDYIAAFFYLALAAFTKPVVIFPRKHNPTEEENKRPSIWRRALPFLRGVLIAIPILGLLASLLSSADPIFASYLENFLSVFKIKNLPEYIFRAFYILTLAYLLSGIYIHAITHNKEEILIGEEKPWMPSFLGFTEAAIVLGSIDTLFVTFVGIQFQYFFGGKTNIHLEGYTYAEYARRGFSELLAVAVFSLLIFLGLSTISRRETTWQRRSFSGLGIGLMGLVAIILVSAFQRLLLYEQAFGFTRLRTYSHIFMVWLGVLLAAVVGLELIKKQRAFALASLIAVIGFGLTINLINVDQLIVVQNVQRVSNGGTVIGPSRIEPPAEIKLDTNYLQTLSTDGTPSLIKAQQNPTLAQNYRDELAAILACQIAQMADERDQKPWESYHWAEENAWRKLLVNRESFSAARVFQNHAGDWWVMLNGEQRPCQYSAID